MITSLGVNNAHCQNWKRLIPLILGFVIMAIIALHPPQA
jgi:hypothetical protein